MHRRELLLAALAAPVAGAYPVPGAAAECVQPNPPEPDPDNDFLWRNFIQPGADGHHLRLVNALGQVEGGRTYSLVLAGYDAVANRVALLTAYHNLSYDVDRGRRVSIDRVREHFLQLAPTRHSAWLSRELEAIRGSYFCRDDARQHGIGTVRMVDLRTPDINDGTYWPSHPVDLALLTFEVDPEHPLNVTVLDYIDGGLRINARYDSCTLPRLVDGRDAVSLTGWRSGSGGDLQLLRPAPRNSHAMFHGQPQPLGHPHRSALSLSTLGNRPDLHGFSGGGVFLRDGGRQLLLGILSGSGDNTQLFTNLYRSADVNLLGWLHEQLDPWPWKWDYAR